MFENYIVTDHVIERYKERVGQAPNKVLQRIKSDLHFTKVKKIINNGSTRYVFTNNSKEFIFIKDHGIWILKTVIKRSRQKQQEAIVHRGMAVAF